MGRLAKGTRVLVGIFCEAADFGERQPPKCVAVSAVLVILLIVNVQSSDEEKTFKSKLTAALIQKPSSKAAHFALNHIDYKSTKYMYDVYKECVSGKSSNSKKCNKIKAQRAKDLLMHYPSIFTQEKVLVTKSSKVSDESKTLKEKVTTKGLQIVTSAAKSKATNLAIDAGLKSITSSIHSSLGKTSRRKRFVTEGNDEFKPSSDLVQSLKEGWGTVHHALRESSNNIRKEVDNEITKHRLYFNNRKYGFKKVLSETRTQSIADAKALLDSWVASEKRLVDILRNVTALTSDSTKNVLDNLAYVKSNLSDSLDILPLNLANNVGQLLETWLDSGKAVIETSDNAVEESKLEVERLLELIAESQNNLTESSENIHLSTAIGLARFLESLMDSGKAITDTLDQAQSQTKSQTNKILKTLTEGVSKLPNISEDAVKDTVDNLNNKQQEIVLIQ